MKPQEIKYLRLNRAAVVFSTDTGKNYLHHLQSYFNVTSTKVVEPHIQQLRNAKQKIGIDALRAYFKGGKVIPVNTQIACTILAGLIRPSLVQFILVFGRNLISDIGQHSGRRRVNLPRKLCAEIDKLRADN